MPDISNRHCAPQVNGSPQFGISCENSVAFVRPEFWVGQCRNRPTIRFGIATNPIPIDSWATIHLDIVHGNRMNLSDQPDYKSKARLLDQLLQANVGSSILERFSTFRELGTASEDQLVCVPGIGTAKARSILAAYDLSTHLKMERAERKLLDSPDLVADLLLTETGRTNQEQAYVALLDSRNRLIRLQHIGTGTLDSVLIHPREVYAPAIEARSASIILAHSHPSGDPTPSQSDINTTRKLASSGKLLGIPLLDHIILGKTDSDHPRGYSSLRELGYLS